MNVTGMLGGMIFNDNCTTAHAQGARIETLIKEMARELNRPADERIIYQGSCHNHLRNTWMDQVELYLIRSLENHLKESFDIIPPHLRVTCRLSELLIQVDKEYNYTANCPKGHDDAFHDWLHKYHRWK
jgi:hypothetical protein